MNIHLNAGIQQYQKLAKPVKSADTATVKLPEGSAVRSDTVVISEDAAAKAELGRLAGAISAQVEESAAPTRLESLKNAVQGGSYAVPAAAVAQAMLSIVV